MKEVNKNVSIIKIGLWLCFIVVLVIIAKFSTSNQKEIKEDKITYTEKLQNLNDNYEYTYDIKIGEALYNFVGKRNKDREVGVKKVNDITTSYFKENNYIYEVIDGGLNQISDLYAGINLDYLDINYLKNLIANKNYEENNSSYQYTLENVNITVTFDDKNITNIDIYLENDYYKLSFANINAIKEVHY